MPKKKASNTSKAGKASKSEASKKSTSEQPEICDQVSNAEGSEKPGKAATSVTTVEPVVQEPVEEGKELAFPNEDMLDEALRLLSEAVKGSRDTGFSKKEFSFHELNFLMNIINFSKAQIIRTKQIVETYDSRNAQARNNLEALKEFLNIKLEL